MNEGTCNNKMQHLEAEAIYSTKKECVHMPEKCLCCNTIGLYENCPNEEELRQLEIDVRVNEINKRMVKLRIEIDDVGKECEELTNLINNQKNYWKEMGEVT